MSQALLSRIAIEPEIMLGKPVIRGTRITVEQILRELAVGAAPHDVVSEHPKISIEDVRAAQLFAAEYLSGAVEQNRDLDALWSIYRLLRDGQTQYQSDLISPPPQISRRGRLIAS